MEIKTADKNPVSSATCIINKCDAVLLVGAARIMLFIAVFTRAFAFLQPNYPSAHPAVSVLCAPPCPQQAEQLQKWLALTAATD